MSTVFPGRRKRKGLQSTDERLGLGSGRGGLLPSWALDRAAEGRRQGGVADVRSPSGDGLSMKANLGRRSDTAPETLLGVIPARTGRLSVSPAAKPPCPALCHVPVAPAPGLPEDSAALRPPKQSKGVLRTCTVAVQGEKIWPSGHGLSGTVDKIIITAKFSRGGTHHCPPAKLLCDPRAAARCLIHHSRHNCEKPCPFPGTQRLCLRGCIVWQEDSLASDRCKFKAEPSLTVCGITSKQFEPP